MGHFGTEYPKNPLIKILYTLFLVPKSLLKPSNHKDKIVFYNESLRNSYGK
jgi:hypothetical protein